LESLDWQIAVWKEELVMKTQNPTLKLATLASSGLLVGGLIAFEAGAFDRLIHANESPTIIRRTQEIDENDIGQSQTSAKEALSSVQAEKIFLPGSKSAGPLMSPGSTEAKETPPHLAPGAEESASDAEKSDAAKPKRSFLPGSKAPSRGLSQGLFTEAVPCTF
jgi:hypothetical protein